MLCLLAFSVAAQLPSTFRQTLNKSVNWVSVEDETNVTVIPDTADYVLITPKSIPPEADPGRIVKVGGLKMYFADAAMFFDIEVHLSTSSLTLQTEDMGNLTLKIGDRYPKNLTLKAEDASSINIKSKADTLKFASIEAKASDEARINIEPFVNTRYLDFYSEDLATINHNGHYAKSGSEYFMDDNTASKRYTEYVDGLDTQNGDNPAKSTKKTRKYHYDFSDRSGLVFLWGFNNWGENIGTGLAGTTDGYELTTTFSSYQLEAVYDFIKTPHFATSIGVGYESDVYHFAAPKVELTTTGSVGTFTEVVPTSPDYRGSTRLVTRYVTLPVAIATSFDGFTIELTAVPGLGYGSNATGLKTKSKTGSHTVKNTDHSDNRYRNPYKFDVRLSLGWHKIGFFIQSSLLPVFVADAGADHHMDREVYPVKFGLQLGF